MRAGQRCSAAKAYLAPNDHKENLDIVSEAFVKKSGSESDSTLTINGSESDSEITDCFESSVSESESSDDGSVLRRLMLAFLSPKKKLL
ncbi:hypothetical protein TNCV_2995541 [Trichonephila clavipes]|nr:hypothetical protein TNCV_2995541 [Trichonephila clavipes]